MDYSKICILIPTFNPNNPLIKTIEVLKENGFNHIIVVDDGSKNKDIFNKIKVDKIISYKKNKGKGNALKEGFKCINKLKFNGVITIDDDFQQDISDIKKIANLFMENKGIYFGVRDFDNAPFVRKCANKLTSKFFRLLYNYSIVDTQTGLRCYPDYILNDLTKIKGDGFEYEMNQLKYLVIKKHKINQIKIKTIYNDNVSHFNFLKDSYKIIKTLLNKNY